MCHKCCCDFDILGVKVSSHPEGGKSSPPPRSSVFLFLFGCCKLCWLFPWCTWLNRTLTSTIVASGKRLLWRRGVKQPFPRRRRRPWPSRAFVMVYKLQVAGTRGRGRWSHFRCGTVSPPPDPNPPNPFLFFFLTTISIVLAHWFTQTKTDCKSSSGSESLGCRCCVCSFSTVSDERDSFALRAWVNLYAPFHWGVSHARFFDWPQWPQHRFCWAAGGRRLKGLCPWL